MFDVVYTKINKTDDGIVLEDTKNEYKIISSDNDQYIVSDKYGQITDKEKALNYIKDNMDSIIKVIKLLNNITEEDDFYEYVAAYDEDLMCMVVNANKQSEIGREIFRI